MSERAARDPARRAPSVRDRWRAGLRRPALRRTLGFRRPALRRTLGALGVALLVGGCMPQPATEQAGRIADLYRVFLAGGIFVALLVWGLATFAILRYRRRSDDSDLPPQTPGSVRLEAVWTGIPLIAVLLLFGLTYVTINAVNARAPQQGVELHVLAFRWGWRFEYPNGGVTVISAPGVTPVAVVPVGQPVHVTLDAADVIHAFFVPAFLFKRDAIPGRESTFDFLVQQPGTYNGACAEFCGVFHDQMPFAIQAVNAAEFGTWLAAHVSSPSPGGSGAPSGSVSAPSASPSTAPGAPAASSSPPTSPGPSTSSATP